MEIICHLTNSEKEGYEQEVQSDHLFYISNSPPVERNLCGMFWRKLGQTERFENSIFCYVSLRGRDIPMHQKTLQIKTMQNLEHASSFMTQII